MNKKRIKGKKSQAAMEFLLTYGWAIVVVVTAIAALAYFGVLDMDRYAPSMCTLPSGLSCLDHGVTVYNGGLGDMNRLVLNIKNNLGFGIKLKSIVSEYDKSNPLGEVEMANGEQTPTPLVPNIPLDDLTNIFDGINGRPAFKEGEKYEIEFTLKIENKGSGLTHDYKGTVTGKVIKE